VGIGDDAAVIETSSDRLMVATTDMLVEGIHFRLDWTDAYRLGWKSVAVNLSDIAAMGALPGSILISLALSQNTDVSFIDSFYAGMEAACERYGGSIAGGDTVSTLDGMILNVAVLGTVEPQYLALRSGARPGDQVLVTGTLGDSAAGLALLLNGSHPDDSSNSDEISWLLERHLAPTPRIPEARIAVPPGVFMP
jgi:thiamine-monophosphate kinase